MTNAVDNVAVAVNVADHGDNPGNTDENCSPHVLYTKEPRLCFDIDACFCVFASTPNILRRNFDTFSAVCVL